MYAIRITHGCWTFPLNTRNFYYALSNMYFLARLKRRNAALFAVPEDSSQQLRSLGVTVTRVDIGFDGHTVERQAPSPPL